MIRVKNDKCVPAHCAVRSRVVPRSKRYFVSYGSMPGDGVFLLFQALMKDEEREDVRTLQSQSCREKMSESLG